MSEGNDLLSIPPSFVGSAEKLGWSQLNHKISSSSVVLTMDEFRLSFARSGEDKIWLLDRYNPDSGWHLLHKMSHPGTTRLEWVLKTSHQVMQMFSSGTKKASKTRANAKTRAPSKK